MRSEAERTIGLYRRHARAWAADRGTALPERVWFDRFAARLAADASVLDIGCGSGEPIGRFFVEKNHGITGVDSSPDLINMCKGHFPRQDWRVADMRTLTLGRSYGGLLAWDSFFHLRPEDQRRMFPVFRRHSAPRAVLMFNSGPAHGVAMGSYRGEPLYHASLDGGEYRALLDANGFDVVRNAVEDPECGGRTVWLAQLR